MDVKFLLNETFYPYIPELLGNKSVVLDIGSMSGIEVRVFRQLFDCEVIAVECDVSEAEKLAEMFALDQKVWVYQNAIAHRDMYAVVGNTGEARSLALWGDAMKAVQTEACEALVECLRLKTFLSQIHRSYVDLIRMNCEGSELYILEDIDGELADRIGQMSFVIHVHLFPLSRYKVALEKVFQWFEIVTCVDTPHDKHYLLVNRKLLK